MQTLLKRGRRYAFIAGALLIASTETRAADLFVDRQFQPDGSEIDRVFQAQIGDSHRLIDENRASRLATEWVTRYYRVTKVIVLSATLQTVPFRYWIVRTTGSLLGRRDLFYAVLLGAGEIIEPKIVQRQTDTPEMTQNLGKSGPQLEIHGEMDIEFATGKGFEYGRPGFDRARPSLSH